MRTIHLATGALAVAAFLLAAPSAGQPDFRQAAWGMTPAEVQAIEKRPPTEVRRSSAEAILVYDSQKMAGLDGRVVYVFAKDKLVTARFLFESEHSDQNDFIRDFQKVEPVFSELYGKPVDDRALWSDDSTQDETKNYLDQDRASVASILPSDRFVGLAVALGHLKLYTRRKARRTEVWHTLWGADDLIHHQAEYRSLLSEPRQ